MVLLFSVRSTNRLPASAAPPKTIVRPVRPVCPDKSARRDIAATSACQARRAVRVSPGRAVRRECRVRPAWTVAMGCPANQVWTACRDGRVRTAYRERMASMAWPARTGRTDRTAATARRACLACRDRREFRANEVCIEHVCVFNVSISIAPKRAQQHFIFRAEKLFKHCIHTAVDTHRHTQTAKPIDLC